MEMLRQPLEALSPGMTFATRGRTVTEADVVAFAALTGDMHPQHVDARWAATSRFGQRVAHGMLVLSYAAALVPFDPERVIALRSVQDVVFKRPVRLGETISATGCVRAIEPIDAGTGLVTIALDVRNGDGLRVMRAGLRVVWSAGPRAEPPLHPSNGAPIEATGLVHAMWSVPL